MGGGAVGAGEWLALGGCCRIEMLRPAGGEEEGVLHHEAGVGGDVDAGFLDEPAGVQGCPGVEGGFGVIVGDAADIGGVPAFGAVEVLLVDDGLVSDGQDVVGDVEQWGFGDGLGVEVPQLLGVGDIEAPQAALNSGPDAVAGLVVGDAQALEVALDSGPGPDAALGIAVDIDAKHGVNTGSIVCRSRAQGRKSQGEPDRAGERIAVGGAVELIGEHSCADGVAGRHGSGRHGVLEIAVHAEKSGGCELGRRDRHF